MIHDHGVLRRWSDGESLDADMHNVLAGKLGQIALEVGLPEHIGVGDDIDRGLILVRRLRECGFSITEIQEIDDV